MAMKGLSNEEITNLLSKSKVHNQYGPKLGEFIESDEAAIMVTDTWPEFSNKKASTVYQGFRKAVVKANLENQVSVRLMDDQVFVLDMEKVALATSTGEVTTSTTDSEQ